MTKSNPTASKIITQNPSKKSNVVYQNRINNAQPLSSSTKSKCTVSRFICIQLLVLLALVILAAIITTIVVVVLDSNSSTPCARTYSDTFTNLVTPTTQCTAWRVFTTGLTCASYSKIRIYGSNDQTGLTNNDPSVATALAVALRYNTTLTVLLME
ncbi:hypothetical protein I4U23_015848 [Adineta vaga]|nr:hypothetical protein I4U23_015848 [Adineta vaga]